MKLLHTSDWHLGMTFSGGISFEADQRYALDSILEIISGEKVDGVLIPGDIFDKSIVSQEALRLYDEYITRICLDLNVPVFLTAGNHDSPERLSGCRRLLEKSGLFICGILEKEPCIINRGDTDIFLLPWISTDKVKSLYPDDAEKIVSMEDAYRIVLDGFRKRFVKGHKNILLAHAFVSGAETSVSDRAAEVGRAAMIGSSVFDGFDYVALGHIHGPQDITDKICYSGSPMAYSFGREEKQEKSVVIYDSDSGKKRRIPLKQLRKRTTLRDGSEALLKADIPAEIRNGYVRLEVTDSYVGLELMAAFREKYPNLLEVSGKSFEKEDSKITMTVDELEKAEDDPEKIFKRFCEDIMAESPDAHLMELFSEALRDYEKGVSEE
ncbi:MAG: exonuclease SbcCD subunit D [Clostridiales bacterium]|nr:exonuclease SbcCD subunit D [Clostridiales bacterium]